MNNSNSDAEVLMQESGTINEDGESPIISIIVPIYNTECYLDECISSILDQHVSEIEVICIDDASTDTSLSILNRWAERDARIRVYQKDCNRGVSDSRNIGLNLARGKYVAFVDSDDWVEPEMYSSLLCLAEETNSDASLGGYRWYPEGNQVRRSPELKTGVPVTQDEALLWCLPQRGEGSFDLFVWDKLFRREALIIDGEPLKFDTSMIYGEDSLWTINALLLIKSFVLCDKMCYRYRRAREGNTMTEMKRFLGMRMSASAVTSNEQIVSSLNHASERIQNNAQQRLLYFRASAVQSAFAVGDNEAFHTYGDHYIADSMKWYRGNRSILGLKWLLRRSASHILFSIRHNIRILMQSGK